MRRHITSIGAIPGGRSERPNLVRATALAMMSIVIVASCGSDTQASGHAGDAGATVSDQAGQVGESSTELVARLRENGLESIASAVDQVDLADVVDSEEYTFLAPNDEAFLALNADEVAELLADPEMLVTVLRNHVVREKLTAADVSALGSIEVASGQSLTVADVDGTVTVGDATIVSTDIDAGNGIVHVVDRVLLP